MTILGKTGLDVYDLQLGANTLGGTADAAESLRILDRYREVGGNFIDTADVYSRWHLGNTGGESERIIGQWLASRGHRDQTVVATKVGNLEPYRTLTAKNIRAALENSLARLQTDYVDIYFLHRDDRDTPLAQTLEGLSELVRDGLVRYIGASNFKPKRLAKALHIQRTSGLVEFSLVQERYNLLERSGYEYGSLAVARAFDLVNLPYRSLANGFLSGRHLPGGIRETAYAPQLKKQFAKHGTRVLNTVVDIAGRRKVAPAAIALAWLRYQPTIAVPLAGARTVAQLEELLQSVDLELDGTELALLDAAGRIAAGVQEVA